MLTKIMTAFTNPMEKAILDKAIESGIDYGGCCLNLPLHLRDKIINKYKLKESGSFKIKDVIRQNIYDSDGTILFESNYPTTDFSRTTRKFCRQYQRPIYLCYCLRRHENIYFSIMPRDCTYEKLKSWIFQQNITSLYLRVSSPESNMYNIKWNEPYTELAGDIKQTMTDLIRISKEVTNIG